MTKKLILTIFMFMTILISAQDTTNSANMERFNRWFEGEFNNYEQYAQDKYDSVKHPHMHIHSIFKKVDLPLFGKNVYYVEQYSDGDREKIYRQRIYSFTENIADTVIELEVFSFNDPKIYRHAHKNVEVLNGLSPEQVKKFPGCEIFWKFDGEKYTGKSKEGSCTFTSSRSGKLLTMHDDLVLTNDAIWILEKATDQDGNHVFGPQDGIHYKLRKCRYFTGWAVIPKDSTRKEYYVARNLRLHDEGERIPLVTAEGDTLQYEIQLAQLTYSGSNTSVLKLGIHERGETKTKLYLWTEPKSKRIGVNLKWLQVGLTLEEPK